MLAVPGAEAAVELSAEARAGVELTLAHLGGVAMVLPAARALAAVRRALPVYMRAGHAVQLGYALYLEHTLMCRAEPGASRADVLARLRAAIQPDWTAMQRRFERGAAVYEARLRGDVEAYRRFNAEELARCRLAGAVWEAWSAGIGLMLAEHDAGRLSEAVAAGRAALHEARPILQDAGRIDMGLLGAAWLAWHEGRPALAARLLARFDAPGRTGSEFGAGTFIRRSIATSWPRLRAEVGDEGLADASAAAETESEAVLMQSVLSVAPGAPGLPRPSGDAPAQ